MKQEKLMDAMNDLDDALIENAAPHAKRSARVLWMRVGTVVACFAVLLGAFLVVRPYLMPDVVWDEPTAEGDREGEIALDVQPVDIYYLMNGEIKIETITVTATPATVFNRWKTLNSVGDEVELIQYRIDSNGTDTVYGEGEEAVVEHKIGDYFELTVIVSGEIRAYLENDETLLDTLERTMRSFAPMTLDEYHLTIE